MSSPSMPTRAGTPSWCSRAACAWPARICVRATTCSAGTNCTAPTSTPMVARCSSCSWVKALRMNGTRENTRLTRTSGRPRLRKAGKESTSTQRSARPTKKSANMLSARRPERAESILADFLVGLALRCVLVDALPAFLSLGLPDVLVSLVFSLVPFMRNAFTHEHDEHLATIGVLVGAVQFVPAEHVVAGTQILAGHAHAALEHDNGVPDFMGMLGLDIAGRKFDLHVDPPHRLVVGEDFDLHAVRQLQNGF